MLLTIVLAVVVLGVGGILLRLGGALVDEPLSEEWRTAHVREHGDGEESSAR